MCGRWRSAGATSILPQCETELADGVEELWADVAFPLEESKAGANRLGLAQNDCLERFSIRSAQRSALSNDGGYVFRRGHVKRGITDANAVRRELRAGVVGDFPGWTFFDGDRVAGRSGEIDGGPWRGHVKRNAVLAREDGDVVRADFVCCVAVGCDAVRANNHGQIGRASCRERV